jgi:hypothetical protein
MATNPFDQFDALVPPQSAVNPFDQFDVPADQTEKPFGPLRQVALAGRAAAQGVVGTLASPYDLPAMITNAVSSGATGLLNKIPGYQKADQAISGALGWNGQLPTVSGALNETLDRAGAYNPETSGERTVSRLIGAAAGAATGVGAGRELINAGSQRLRDAGGLLAANPRLQVGSALAGAGAADVAQRGGIGPTGQLVAGTITGAVPSLLATSAPAMLRGALRGSEQGRQTLNDNAQVFRNLGTEGTIGDVSPSRFAKGTEAYLSRGITGSGPIEAQLTAQNKAFGQAAGRAAQSVSRNVDETKAGLAIERGLQGFVAKSKDKQRALYGEVDRHVNDAERVSVDNTKQLLDELHTDIPGAPAQSRLLRDPAAERLRNAIKADTEGFDSVAANPEYKHLFEGKNTSELTKELFGEFSADGKTPYEALRRVRTFVGAAMSEPSLTRATRDNFSKIYGALSEDIRTVITGNGPAATKAFDNANNFTRGFMKRMELVDTAIDKNGGPEKVFKAALSGTDDGATVINAVMKSLPQEGRDSVSAMVLERIGRGDGRKFDINAFKANWEQMSPRAKATLFANLGPEAKSFITNISKVVDIKNQGSRAFGGDRAGGSSWVQQGQVGAGLLSGLSLVGGNPLPALGFAGMMAGQGAAGRGMVSPNALRFLGQKSLPIHFGPSAQIAQTQNALQQQAFENRLAR